LIGSASIFLVFVIEIFDIRNFRNDSGLSE
jgi:hypothetical protein